VQVIATIAAACGGFAAGWICRTAFERRQFYWLDYCRRRGSNPPPPGRKPAPPAGPPEQPLTAQLIRYWAWEQEQVRRAAAGQSPIRMDEGRVQRGNGHGGPTTPKPPIKPEFPPPREIPGDVP
jgi:hypothetical protein